MMTTITTRLKFEDYTVLAVLTPAEEGGYTVTFPHLPGCVTEGDTLQEALANAREAADLWLESVAHRLPVKP